MPEMPERLMPKSDQIAAKVMDGEAVIIDLASGVYYSMDGGGRPDLEPDQGHPKHGRHGRCGHRRL